MQEGVQVPADLAVPGALVVAEMAVLAKGHTLVEV
nr:MAG TPA: hypothetical protein [Caudoviricetes sp.]